MTSDVTTPAGRFEVTPHRCFACGELNERGLHLQLHVAGDTCWADLVLDEAFQGWDGIAHGGIIATILDEVMAWALASADAWGFTARMTIEYKRPLPVGAAVRGEGRLVERRRRLLTTSGRLVDPVTGDVYATAEGLYVAAPEERRRVLKERYGFRLVADAPGGPQPGVRANAEPAGRGAGR